MTRKHTPDGDAVPIAPETTEDEKSQSEDETTARKTGSVATSSALTSSVATSAALTSSVATSSVGNAPVIFFGLPIATGLVAACSTAFGPVIPLLFLYPCLFTLLVASNRSAKHAFWRGALAGFVANAILFYWVTPMLEDFGHMPFFAALPLSLLFAGAQGLGLAFASCFAHLLLDTSMKRGERRKSMKLPFASGLSLFGVLSVFPTLFPWNPAVPLVSWTLFAQVAELGGAPLLDALCFFSGAFLASAFCSRRPRALAAATLLVVVPLVVGALLMARMETRYETAETLTVGVVQPNVSIEDKHDPTKRREILNRLVLLTAEVREEAPGLIVWPETAFPYAVPRHASALTQTGAGETPLIAGVLTFGDGRCDRYNSAAFVDGRGNIDALRDKVELIPFSENIPFHSLLTPFHELLPCPGMVQGDVLPAQEIAGARIAVLNCYEDVLPHVSTWYPDAELLVNLTNDAWFGDTTAPHLHQLAARLRTIETRRELIRSVNTGISSHVDAFGREVWTTPTFEATTRIATARLFAEPTFYQLHGDLLGGTLRLLLLLSLSVVLGRRLARRVRRRKAGE